MISPDVKFSGRYLIAYQGYAALVHVKFTTLKLLLSKGNLKFTLNKNSKKKKIVSVTAI